jgi:DNA-binding IclR family transcriptional regulator
MRDIVRELNEITQLAVRDSIYNVYLAKVDCDHPIQLISQVGKRLYCHATALGKVLLAACTNEEIDEMYANISLPRFTPHTITDLSTLKKEIAQCRVQGYAEDHEEYVAGLRCVAVPLLSQSSEVLAAMSVSLPAPRATPERLTQALSALQVGARAFQCRLMQVDRWEK